MKTLEFLEMAKIKKIEHKGDEYSLLDKITPIFLTMLQDLNDIEKHIIFAIIMRPRKVTKEDETKKDISKYLLAKDLTYELKLQTKEISIYLKKLTDKGLIVRKPINNKNFEYNIIDELFIKWFIFRNRNPKLNNK